MTKHTTLTDGYNECVAAPVSKPKKKRPSPISLRLSEDELKALRRAAAGQSINGYIRGRLFGDVASHGAGLSVRDDHQALARILGRLGQSSVFNSLSRLLLAQEEGRVAFDDDLECELRSAVKNVSLMRDDLMIALGLRKV